MPWQHVRITKDGSYKPIYGPVHNVLTLRANPYNTPQTFFTLLITRLLLYNNAYVLPEWGEDGQLKWLYPLPFATHSFETTKDGQVMFKFAAEGGPFTFNWQDIIHLQRFPTLKGGTGNQAIDNWTTALNAIQQQAVTDSANSMKLSVLLQPKNALKSKDAKTEIETFKKDYLTVENITGMGVVPGDYAITQLQPRQTPLNVQMLQAVVSQLYNYFGTSSRIVEGTADELAYQQHIEGTVKPIIYQIQEEFSYKLCELTELAKGQRIQANTLMLEIEPLRDRTAFIKEMIFAGALNRNEARQWAGLPRGPEKLDEFLESKNFGQTLEPGNYEVKGGADAGNGTDGNSEKSS